MKGGWTIFRKEIIELFRDARSIVVSLGVPIVLFPLVFGVMSANLKNQADPEADPIIVGTSIEDEALLAALREVSQLRVVATDVPRDAVVAGSAEVGLATTAGADYDSLRPSLELFFAPGRPRSLLGVELLSELIVQNTAHLRSSYLETVGNASAGIDGSLALPPTVQRSPVSDPKRQAGADFLAFLVPLLLIVATCISPLPSAADIGAGEKERGTLPTLLVSPASGAAIVLGKLAAVSTMGVLGALSFGAGVTISILLSPQLLGVDQMVFSLGPGKILLLAVFAVVLAVAFSAVELLISFVAKSPKEAQILFLPLLILATAAGYGTYLMDLNRLSPWLPHVPIINVGLAVKQIILGGPTLILTSAALWLVFYVGAALSACLVLVRRESVVLRT